VRAAHALERFAAPIDEALEQRMIVPVSGAICTYSFSHALIRDALYAGLSSGQRVRLHRRIGESLEALEPAPPGSQLAALAHHFFECTSGGGDFEKAAAYARRAAEHAQATLAYEEAARCYDLAVRALARRGDDEPRRCELFLAMGEAHRQASLEAAAREAFQRAGELARRTGEPRLLARAALGFAGVVIGIDVDRHVIDLLEEGLAALGEEDSGLRAMLLGRLAMELYYSPDFERRDAISAEAVSTARRAGDGRALALALEARHFAIWSRTGPQPRLALTDEMIRLAGEIGSTELVMRGHHLRISALLELGRIEDVDAAIATYARLADDLRQPTFQWGLAMCRAMRAMMDGRFDEAEQLALKGLAIGQGVQPETAANLFAAQLFFLRR
jgi:predicted ATPase